MVRGRSFYYESMLSRSKNGSPKGKEKNLEKGLDRRLHQHSSRKIQEEEIRWFERKFTPS